MTANNWPHTRRAVRRLRINIAELLLDLAFWVSPIKLKDTTHDR